MKPQSEIMLVNLPMDEHSIRNTGKPILVAENLGISYLAASLREGSNSVKIVDAIAEGFSTEEILKKIKAEKPRLVGLPVFQTTRKAVLSFCQKLKQEVPSVKTILGGHLARLASGALLSYPGIDFLCTGEGEGVINEVTSALNTGNFKPINGIAWRDGEDIIINPPAPFEEKLDALPWPVRDTLPTVLNRNGIARVVSSRGCYQNCSFCSVHRFMGSSSKSHWRTRSIDDVIEEIDFLRKSYDIKVVAFNEDNFFGPCEEGYARAEKMARTLITKNWNIKFAIACRADAIERDRFQLLKKAGLVAVEMGIESGAPTALKRWHKGVTVEQNLRALKLLDDLDLSVTAGFIMFDAHTTVDELEQNRVFIRQCKEFEEVYSKFELRLANRVIPYVGTQIRTKYEKENRLHSDELHTETFDDYTFCDAKIEYIYNVMQRWESFSAPVRQLCWHFAMNNNSEKAREYLKDLMDLSMRTFETALEDMRSDQEYPLELTETRPWPKSCENDLRSLAAKALNSVQMNETKN